MPTRCTHETSPLAFTASSGPDREIRVVSCPDCDQSYWYRNGELIDLTALLPELALDGGRGKRRIAG